MESCVYICRQAILHWRKFSGESWRLETTR